MIVTCDESPEDFAVDEPIVNVAPVEPVCTESVKTEPEPTTNAPLDLCDYPACPNDDDETEPRSSVITYAGFVIDEEAPAAAEAAAPDEAGAPDEADANSAKQASSGSVDSSDIPELIPTDPPVATTSEQTPNRSADSSPGDEEEVTLSPKHTPKPPPRSSRDDIPREAEEDVKNSPTTSDASSGRGALHEVDEPLSPRNSPNRSPDHERSPELNSPRKEEHIVSPMPPPRSSRDISPREEDGPNSNDDSRPQEVTQLHDDESPTIPDHLDAAEQENNSRIVQDNSAHANHEDVPVSPQNTCFTAANAPAEVKTNPAVQPHALQQEIHNCVDQITAKATDGSSDDENHDRYPFTEFATQGSDENDPDRDRYPFTEVATDGSNSSRHEEAHQLSDLTTPPIPENSGTKVSEETNKRLAEDEEEQKNSVDENQNEIALPNRPDQQDEVAIILTNDDSGAADAPPQLERDLQNQGVVEEKFP